MRTIVVSLYGGPGTGKSTTAAHLFVHLKRRQVPCELIREVSKDLVYAGDAYNLEDQLMILARQAATMRAPCGKVRFLVSDAPLLMGLLYTPDRLRGTIFTEMTYMVYSSFNNVNVRLNRVKPFEQYGRNHDEEKATALDERIRTEIAGMLPGWDLELDADEQAAGRIADWLLEKYPDEDRPPQGSSQDSPSMPSTGMQADGCHEHTHGTPQLLPAGDAGLIPGGPREGVCGDPACHLRLEQIGRESAARDVARGNRLSRLRDGDYGPVLRRWVNSEVQPIAKLLREVSTDYLAGRLGDVAKRLDSPGIELSAARNPIRPLLEWLHRGVSKGRSAGATTYAEDLVLAFMATAIEHAAKLSGDRAKTSSLNSVMSDAAGRMRETALGQCLASIQGASAMAAIRERYPSAWKQSMKLDRIAATLQSQVKPEVLRLLEEKGVTKLSSFDRIVNVIEPSGASRMLTLKRTPDRLDWTMMALTYRADDDAATDPHRSKWLGLAEMIFACAQVSGGWFEIAMEQKRGSQHKTRYLALSDHASKAIIRDGEKWASLGFIREPMVCSPDNGDYLTVKHRPVTGARPVKGLWTDTKDTVAWQSACALADTGWQLNEHISEWYRVADSERGAAHGLTAGDSVALNSLRRIGPRPFYLPITLDFRGRVYYRTQGVSPQRGDFGKALLSFPPNNDPTLDRDGGAEYEALVMHMTGLMGKDKATRDERFEWWFNNKDRPLDELCGEADYPCVCAERWACMKQGDIDRIPIQLDGTCNGLQHLTAMMRDEQAAPHVNLTACGYNVAPADLYGVVAKAVMESLHSSMPDDEKFAWWARLQEAGVKTITRKVTKKAVMTLPYGASSWGLHDSMGLTLQDVYHLDDRVWREHPKYLAFDNRDLTLHPLFRQDAGMLAGLVWKSIAPAIPKAMATMDTLKAIGAYVGARALTWEVVDGLWPVMAKAESALKDVTSKGFHMPGSVRRLMLNTITNKVSKKEQKSGIVPNFIHSQDACHMRMTLKQFRLRGGTNVGGYTIACWCARSEAALMGECLRDAFVRMYEVNPLALSVRIEDPETGVAEEFNSWYALAEAAGVAFPETGTYDVREVLKSAWFFS